VTTVPAGGDSKSDAELITAVRNGTIAAYGTLYERHVASAYNLARQLSRSPAEADDLVSEAFAKVLDTLRAGKGPDSAFRAYLLTALRHTAYDKTRKDKRVDLNEDMSEVSGALGSALTVPFSDTAVQGLERTMAARAFARLPERWQAVLWHTEIEQQSPAEVAPLLGLTPNGVSALAYRAREGLRQAYLQVHLAETTADRCRATADRLGAWTRDGLSKRERTQVETHLDECERCRALAAELADVNGAIRSIVAPLVLGGAALGYLAAVGGAKASAATAAAAVGAGAAGSAAGGAAAGAAVPRQFMGVAASGAAVVAAVAIALTAGGAKPVPTAIQPQANPPAVQAPAKPAPKPAPAQPAPPPPAPQPPADVPAADPPPAPQPVPPPPEQPLPPDIMATPPSGGVELIAGGSPVDLPITVRNDGGSTSEPVTVKLNLPRGVEAVDPAGGGSTTMSAAAPRASAPGGETVKCPGGTGTVTCSTGRGLEPDESMTLLFRLVADDTAQPGQIVGTVSSGTAATLKIRVPVQVEVRDGVDLYVKAHGWHLTMNVTNTGETTKPATVTLDQPMWPYAGAGHGFDCTSDADSTTCTSDEALEPGEEEHFHGVLRNWGNDGDVSVTATIGAASDSQTVEVWCFIFCGPGILPPDPDEPTETSEPSVPLPPEDLPEESHLPEESETPSSAPESSDLEDLLPDVGPSTSKTTTTTTTSDLHRPAQPKGLDSLLDRLLRG